MLAARRHGARVCWVGGGLARNPRRNRADVLVHQRPISLGRATSGASGMAGVGAGLGGVARAGAGAAMQAARGMARQIARISRKRGGRPSSSLARHRRQVHRQRIPMHRDSHRIRRTGLGAPAAQPNSASAAHAHMTAKPSGTATGPVMAATLRSRSRRNMMLPTHHPALRPNARTRHALSESGAALGRAHRLGARAGEELAADGLRLAGACRSFWPAG